MPELFTILLKINVVLVLFAAAYYLVLRRLTFYTINRVFLVFGILFSTIYPFINLTDFFHNQQQLNQKVVAFVPQLNQKVNALVPLDFITLHWQSLSILFYVGAAIMALRLIVQFVSLYLMHKKSKPGAVANFPVRILNEAVSPFSFWQTVYINPSLHQEKELQTILEHEQIHVKEWHSLDIILAELSVVFYWFNPGVWLMKKAVKENLEFITDQKILNKGIDRKAYQYSLLDVGNLTPAVAIVNNFNLSDLKKRIKMMNVKRSSRLTLSRYLLVTPVLLITTLAFTVSKKDINKHLIPLRQVLINNHVIAEAEPLVITANKKISKKKKVIAVATATKPDSSGKVFHFLKSIFISTRDTVPSKGELLELAVKFMDEKVAPKGKTDSVTTSIRFVQGVKISGKVQGVSLKKDNEDKTSNEQKVSQVVTVKGYSFVAKHDPVDQTREQLILKGTSLKADSLTSFYVNGEKITPEDFSKIDPNNIKTLTIQKRKSDEIIVVGKKKE